MPSGSRKSCSSKRRSKPSCRTGSAGCGNCRTSKPSRRPARKRFTNFGRASDIIRALLCTPLQPQCHICPITKYCLAREQERVAELPNLGRRPNSIPRRFAAFVAQKHGRFLVRQRPPGVVNAHLWEFPNVEVASDRFNLKRTARAVLGFTPVSLTPLAIIKHSITRYRIT